MSGEKERETERARDLQLITISIWTGHYLHV